MRKTRAVQKPPIPMLEQPKKTEYLSQLNWILNFASADIQGMPPGAFLNILHEFLVFVCEGELTRKELLKDFCYDTEQNRRGLQMAHTYISGFLEKLIKTNQVSLYKNWDITVRKFSIMTKHSVVVDENKVRLESMPILRIARGPVSMDPSDFVEEYTKDSRFMGRFKRDYIFDDDWIRKDGFDPESAVKFSGFYLGDMDAAILPKLIPLLERFPLDHIRVCPDCSKYFFVRRRKQSDLCSVCLKRKKNRELYYRKKGGMRKGDSI